MLPSMRLLMSSGPPKYCNSFDMTCVCCFATQTNSSHCKFVTCHCTCCKPLPVQSQGRSSASSATPHIASLCLADAQLIASASSAMRLCFVQVVANQSATHYKRVTCHVTCCQLLRQGMHVCGAHRCIHIG